MVDAAWDEDLYCLTCGYNLRGLSGDPIRCPECGRSHLRSALRAAQERKKRLPAPRDWFILGGIYAGVVFVCVASALVFGPFVSLIELIAAATVLATIIVVHQSRSG